MRLICRHGKPCELDDLKKLSLHAARDVVVLGCGAKPGLADSHTITVVCVRAARAPRARAARAPAPPARPRTRAARAATRRATRAALSSSWLLLAAWQALRCLPQRLPPSTLVVVELQLPQTVEIARQVAGRAMAHTNDQAENESCFDRLTGPVGRLLLGGERTAAKNQGQSALSVVPCCINRAGAALLTPPRPPPPAPARSVATADPLTPPSTCTPFQSTWRRCCARSRPTRATRCYS